jgi:hypothetical protein
MVDRSAWLRDSVRRAAESVAWLAMGHVPPRQAHAAMGLARLLSRRITQLQRKIYTLSCKSGPVVA